MDKIIERSLILLGLNPLEIKFYLSSFTLGPSTVPDIAKKANIHRSTSYLIANNLASKGLLIGDQKGYSSRFQTVEPKKLLQIISDRQRRFRRQELDLEENLGQLQSLYNTSDIHPKVRLYEGHSGLLSVWQDILSTSSEILLWTNQQTENQFFGPINHDKFITERLVKKIPIRVLATYSPQSLKLQHLDSQNLRQTKILPKNINFSAETYIYDHKIAMLDYNKDIIGIIIESTPLFTQQQAQFELVWQLLK